MFKYKRNTKTKKSPNTREQKINQDEKLDIKPNFTKEISACDMSTHESCDASPKETKESKFSSFINFGMNETPILNEET